MQAVEAGLVRLNSGAFVLIQMHGEHGLLERASLLAPAEQQRHLPPARGEQERQREQHAKSGGHAPGGVRVDPVGRVHPDDRTDGPDRGSEHKHHVESISEQECRGSRHHEEPHNKHRPHRIERRHRRD